MARDFPFVEAKQKAKQLALDALIVEIRKGLAATSSGGRMENEYIKAYSLPQSVIQENPTSPWNLSPLEVSKLRERILSNSGYDRLDSTFDLTQGVTPGGGCLDVFIVRSTDVVESSLLSPTVEAEDIAAWNLAAPKKWLLYPYGPDGTVLSLGQLDFDLEQSDARKKIDSQIATGSIKYPRAAHYLVQYYDRLVAREAEKRTWKEYGKTWYEYHRPRDPAIMRSTPKIITRRMTYNVEFSLDDLGFIPTDGCIALTFKKANAWLRKGLENGLSEKEAILFCLAALNSSIMKLLLKSSADAWQGGFLQVREDNIGLFPLKRVTKDSAKEISTISQLTNEALSNTEKRKEIDSSIIKLYGLHGDSGLIENYLKNV